VTNWAVISQLKDNTSEFQRSITVVYRTDRQALPTARLRRADQLATADTCSFSVQCVPIPHF